MRVLFNTFAASSHLYPMVSLAWALHAAGHEVRVASQPDLVETIVRTSLPAVPVGEALEMARQMREDTSWRDDESLADIDMTENRPEKLTWEFVSRTFQWYRDVPFQGLSSDSVMTDIIEFAREWRPDLVLWDSMTFSGSVAARACGAAHARFLFGQDYIGRMRGHFVRLMREQPAHLRRDPVAEWLGPVVSGFGDEFDEELVVGQWSVDATVPWLRLPVALEYVPVRYVPYTGAAPVPEWLPERPDRPRVCLTAGLGTREVMGEDWIPYAALFEAVADLDIEVVATLNAEQLASAGVVPDNVRVFDFYPLNVLVPTCSAVIHHGGGGAFAMALAHGVPQLVMSTDVWWDAIDKAKELAARRAAVYLEPEGLNADVLRENLVRLLEDPRFRVGAAQARAEFRATPSPNAIVPRLEALTAKHRIRQDSW